MPRFVVLEHRWDGEHWDVMLEDGEKLRTWAVDAPIATGVDLPARALPDHRLAYLDYEGPVSGGRGTVRRLDRGDYEALDWGPDRVRVRLLGAQLVGTAELWKVGGGASASSGGWVFRLGNVD